VFYPLPSENLQQSFYVRCCWTFFRSTELDSIDDDVMENDEDVDSDEERSVLENCNDRQGTVTRSRVF